MLAIEREHSENAPVSGLSKSVAASSITAWPPSEFHFARVALEPAGNEVLKAERSAANPTKPIPQIVKRIGTEACSTPPRFPSTIRLIRLSLTARPSRKRRKGEGGSSILADD